SQAVRLKPGYAEAENNFGAALASQGDFRGAITHFAEAVRGDSKNSYSFNNLVAAHYRLALDLEKQGQRGAAEQELTETLRLNPNYQDARNALQALKTGGQ